MRWFWPGITPLLDPVKILMILTSCRLLESSSQNAKPPGRSAVDESSKVDSYLKKGPGEKDGKEVIPLSQKISFPSYIPVIKNPLPVVTRRSPYEPYWYSGMLPYSENLLPELPYVPFCSDPTISCRNLSAHCLNCDITWYSPDEHNCTYGDLVDYQCYVKPNAKCKGAVEFDFKAKCRFCYQTEAHEHSCIAPTSCRVAGDPYKRVRKNCTVNHDIICLGRRTFYKMEICDYSSGYRWSIAMLLSVTVGGFGADRFYLGHWQEGVGKLFSFGGLGVWTLVDIVLIAIGYLRPRDGSLYIDYDA